MNENNQEPTDDEIGELARKYWIEKGRPEGKAEEHWSQAEQELRTKAATQTMKS